MDFKPVLLFLILEAGDIEKNLGSKITEHSLSITYSNIRSIQNKDFITENFLDFDISCSTETHLDVNI